MLVMRRPLNKESAIVATSLVLRVGLACLFAYAASQKLGDLPALATSITHYRVVPQALIGWGALMVPSFELVTALGLVSPWLHRGSALLSAAMLWIFAAAMIQARLRGINLECGCFGADSTVMVGTSTIARNLVLGAIALWIALEGSRSPAKTS